MANTLFRLNDLNDDLAFVKYIMTNDKEAVAFFLETYSKPLLEYIGRSVLKLMPLPVYRPRQKNVSVIEQFDEYSYGIGCYGEYYMFIASLFDALSKQPQWNKLGYYAENPRSRLYTYLSVITTRHFLKHHPDKADDKSAQEEDTSSYDDNERLYLMLCLKLTDKDDDVVFSEQMYDELEAARRQLKEKDNRVIQLTCFSDLSTMQIAEAMKDEFDADPTTMRRKDVQTRISQWKNRALVRLAAIITAEKNKQLFPTLLEYAKNNLKT